MLRARTLAVLCSLLALTASAQTWAQTADPIARVFHATPPLPSYDVATIKPFDENAGVLMSGPNMARRIMDGPTARTLIRRAYGSSSAPLATAQVIGGPDWIDKDKYSVNGKPSPDLEVALKKMTNEERSAQNRMLQQSLLANRLHLKVHFEVREMPVYELVPAKGGLKIKAVDAPPERDPNAPPQPPPAFNPNGPLPPGMMMIMMKSNGERSMKARATDMSGLLNLIRNNSGEAGDRPIIDRTGFTGHFDVDDLSFAPLTTNADAANPASDAPSLATALEESLGIKLVATKGPVEVIVIDSIDHPTDN